MQGYKQDMNQPNIESNVPLQDHASDEEETDENDNDDHLETMENISLDDLNDDNDDDIENVASNSQEDKRWVF